MLPSSLISTIESSRIESSALVSPLLYAWFQSFSSATILPWMAAGLSCGNAVSERAQTIDNNKTDRRIAESLLRPSIGDVGRFSLSADLVTQKRKVIDVHFGNEVWPSLEVDERF